MVSVVDPVIDSVTDSVTDPVTGSVAFPETDSVVVVSLVEVALAAV